MSWHWQNTCSTISILELAHSTDMESSPTHVPCHAEQLNLHIKLIFKKKKQRKKKKQKKKQPGNEHCVLVAVFWRDSFNFLSDLDIYLVYNTTARGTWTSCLCCLCTSSPQTRNSSPVHVWFHGKSPGRQPTHIILHTYCVHTTTNKQKRKRNTDYSSLYTMSAGIQAAMKMMSPWCHHDVIMCS